MSRPGRVRPSVTAGAALVAALVGVGGLAGCGTSDPAASAVASTAASGQVPAVGAGQVRRVLAAVAQVGPGALDTRLADAELEVRQAALTVHDAVPTSPEPAPLAGEELLSAVPAAGAWPRWFVTAVAPGAGAVPQVLVLVQTAPREPYRVTASASLLPGASLPELATSGETAEALAGDAPGLAATPSDALAGYADLLARGTDAPAAATTADDAFREQVLAEQQAERDGVSEYVSYAVTHAPRDGDLWTLRTADGGALVIGVLQGQRTFTPRGVGVSQTLPPDLAALAGRDTATKGLDVTTAEVVVLRVPPQGDDGPAVTLVAAQRGTTGVQVR